MVNRYLPSFFGRGEDPFRSLFQEVQKTFEDFSRRTPFARLGSEMLSPKIDVAESKDAIEITAELPGIDEKDRVRQRRIAHPVAQAGRDGEEAAKDRNQEGLKRRL